MSFRSRLVIALMAAGLIPLTILAFGMRREMTKRLTRQSTERVSSVIAQVNENLGRLRDTTRARLRRLSTSLEDDNQFRLAAVTGEVNASRSLLDWAGDAMRSSQMALLEVQDSAGRIISSGHFRNQFGQSNGSLRSFLVAAGAQGGLVEAVTPTGDIRALVLVDSFSVAGRRFYLAGGPAFNVTNLISGNDPEVSVRLDSDSVPSPGQLVARVALPQLREGGNADSAFILMTRRPDVVAALRSSVDRWSMVALIVFAMVSILTALWLGGRISRPLSDLAAKTSTIDLDRLDQDFQSDRSDEIGSLSRLLNAMIVRLRGSSARIREVERRLATGELARQVNHDVKNGLAPIRHVLRHLGQVAESDPGQLAALYQERRGTLESSVAYLETLAQQYARLSPSMDRAISDLNSAIDDVTRSLAVEGKTVQTQLAPGPVPVRGDRLVLRRIVENLVRNALEAVQSTAGAVQVKSSVTATSTGRSAQLEVIDEGPGMTQQELNRAFEDFFTTKPEGTGLGLSVVQRLVGDLGGSLRVETAPGRGTRFVIGLPLEEPLSDSMKGAS